jgi:hypothetical protein
MTGSLLRAGPGLQQQPVGSCAHSPTKCQTLVLKPRCKFVFLLARHLEQQVLSKARTTNGTSKVGVKAMACTILGTAAHAQCEQRSACLTKSKSAATLLVRECACPVSVSRHRQASPGSSSGTAVPAPGGKQTVALAAAKGSSTQVLKSLHIRRHQLDCCTC